MDWIVDKMKKIKIKIDQFYDSDLEVKNRNEVVKLMDKNRIYFNESFKFSLIENFIRLKFRHLFKTISLLDEDCIKQLEKYIEENLN